MPENRMQNLKHITIIMDGNRRWARQNNLPIKLGHKKGAETLKQIAVYANEIGLQYLTVYAFSTENWNRTKEEVGALMLLLENYIKDFLKSADNHNIKINVIGDKKALSDSLLENIKKIEDKTKKNTGLTLNIAFNYGGRREIIDAVKEISKDVLDGKVDISEISEEKFAKYLYTSDMPDPDLLIRTSGELRTSNFLPWQLAYTEFIFLDKYWPDFSNEDLEEAISEYNKRKRRFGAK